MLLIASREKKNCNMIVKHARANIFQIGTEVLKKDFVRKKRKGGKLDPKLVGPYVITAKDFTH